jgi:hypothetical protein
MRFFTFVSGDFEDKAELHGKESVPFIEFLISTFTLERSIAETIVFALAFCSSPQGLWSLHPSHCGCSREQSRPSRPSSEYGITLAPVAVMDPRLSS